MPIAVSAEVPPRPWLSSKSSLAVFALALCAILGAASPAAAFNSYTLVSPSGTMNWSTAPWTCTPGPCTAFPGQGGGDVVDFNTGSGSYTMVMDTSTTNPVTLTNSSTGVTLNFTAAGFLILNSGSTFSNGIQVNLSSGQMRNNGTLGMSGGAIITVSGGTFTNWSTATFNTGTTFNVSSGLVDMSAGGGVTMGSGSTMNWSGGTVQGPGILLNANGGPPAIIGVTGSTALTSGAQIQNNGTINYQPGVGALTLSGASSILNQSNLNLLNDASINDGGGGVNYINNGGSGIITKSAGTLSDIKVQLLNSAQTISNAGTISLSGGGTHGGTFTTSAGTKIDFAGGTHTLTSVSVTFNGPGVRLTGGTLTNSQPIIVSTFTQTGGTLKGTGSNTFTVSTFTWSGGTQQSPGATLLAPGGTATLDGAVAPMVLDGRSFNTSASTGTINYTATTNTLDMENVGSIQTALGTNFNCSTDAAITTSTSGFINNLGAFRKTGGSGTTIVAAFFQNQNIISSQVSGGSIRFTGGGNSSGQMTSTVPTATIDVSAGTFQLLTGATLVGPGSVRATGSGTIDVTDNVSSDNFQITSASARLKVTGLFTFSLNPSAIFDFQTGVIQGVAGGNVSIPNLAQMLVGSGGSTILDNITINNAGQINYNSLSDFGFQNASLIKNNGPGVIHLQDNGTLKVGVGGGSISNNLGASFIKMSTSGTSVVQPAFNNTGGTVDNQLGPGSAIVFAGGGTHTGSMTSSGNGEIEFAGVTNTFNLSGGTLSGSGTFVLSSGIVNVNLNTNVPFFKQTGGTLTGNALFSIAQGYTWSGGSQSGSGTTNVTQAATGTIDGANGPMSITSRSFINDGTIAFTSSANALTINGANFTNTTAGPGTLDIQATNGQINGTGTIINQSGATISRTTNSGVAAIFNPVTNSGSVDVQTGTLAFKGGGTHTGTFTVASGATLEFGGGAHTIGTNAFNIAGNLLVFAGSATFNVAYTVGGTQVQGGTLTLSNAGTTGTFNQSSGTLTLNANLTNNGTGFWAGGTINGTGAFIISATGSLDMTGSVGAMSLDTASITNNNNLRYSSIVPPNSLSLINGGSITNNNLFDVASDDAISGPGVITNNKTMKKSSGTSTSFAGAVTNATINSLLQAMSGTMNFLGGFTQTAGTTQLIGGNIASASTIPLGGLLQGAGSVGASVNNSGTISPGLGVNTGVINITGNYTQANSGTLNIRIGGTTPGAPTSGYDFLNISGSAAFNGTLNVSTTGGYIPPNGQIFDPIVFASHTTDFSNPVLNPFGAGTSWNRTFTATTQRLTAVVSSDMQLAITDSPDPVPAGATVNYTATVTNNGPAATTATSTLTFTLTGGGTIFLTSGTITCSNTATTANCTVPALISGGTASATLQVTAPGGGGTSTLSGTVTSSNADSNTPNNTASQSTVVTPVAELQLTKTAGPGALVAGSNVTYTITVTNNGPSSASSIQVVDPGVAGLTFVSNSGACTGTFPCLVNGGGSLPSGQSAVISSTYTVSPAASGTISNTATVSSPATDTNPGNNSSTATNSVTQSADISVSKAGTPNAAVGGTVTYFINVKNTGPSNATAVVVNDPTPARLTFVSNSGACSTPYPCPIGNMTPGQTATITSTYTVTAGPSATIANIATATYTSTDPNASNDSATATTIIGCPIVPASPVPNDNATNVPLNGTLHWNNAGGQQYKVYLGPAGNGCNKLLTTTTSTSASFSNLQPDTQYEWRVEAISPSCPTQTSACFTFTTTSNCPSQPPTLTAPANGTGTASPVTLSWTPVAGATYQIFASVGGAATTQIGSTSDTTFAATFGNGAVVWYVVAIVPGNCPTLQSANGNFNNCNGASAPLASVVASAASGQSYDVKWEAIPGATKYEVDEALADTFAGAVTTTVTTTSLTFTHSAPGTTPQAFFYRVRAFGGCGQAFGPYSQTVRAVVIPIPATPPANPNVNVPVGSKKVVVQNIFVPGFPDATLPFAATVDKPWLNVTPTSGILTPSGVILQVSADPANLPNGTFTGTVLVTFPTSGKVAGLASKPVVSVPVSISLVTPVLPSTTVNAPAANALIIPSVGHLDGFNSHWQSDVRVTNPSFSTQKYSLQFTPDDISKGIKTTTISVEAGGTTALDDIIRNWYGIGALGESANGVLTINPLTTSGKGAEPDASTPTSALVASSRTYNVTTVGTLGQYIPAVPFSAFIGKAANATSATPILSLQQVVQSSAYRTNIGVVEGSGVPASVLLTVFDTSGKKLLDFPLDLKGGEQRQLNGFLASQGISLPDGRVEVKVLSGNGRVTAYASVVDNLTNDPLLVSGVQVDQLSSDRYVMPGVADINNGLANWRTDMRVFNAGTVPEPVTLTFYPQNGSGDPVSRTVPISAGEVKMLDNILQSFFSLSNTGGAVHVETPGNSSLVVSGRTYNQTTAGTYGQFIPAVTPFEAVGKDGRTLNILQVEDSVRYRTNVGLAEVSGKPVTIEMTVVPPDSKVTPKITMTLGANEFQQIPLLRNLGLTNTYNARITIRVIDGDGKVTAYGSVIDMNTQDPTYVAAQ